MPVNVFDVVDAVVARLKLISGVTSIVPAASITAYKDGLPGNEKLANAIHDAPFPSILVYYTSTAPFVGQRRTLVTHKFSMAIKGGGTGATFADIFYAIVTGVPSGSTLDFIKLPLASGMTPINLYPSASRTQIVIDVMSSEYIEYFDVAFDANET